MKLRQRYQIVIFTLLLCGGYIIAGSAFASSPATLTITGTGASIGAMKLMGKGFQKHHARISVEVLPSIGSTGGISAVQEGKIDIGLSSRSFKPEERQAEVLAEPYGRTAVIFGVQAINPARGLTLAEIEAIYAGKRPTWPDGTPIRLILRPLSDAYSVYLAGISPGIKSAAEKAHSLPGVFVGNTDQEAAVQIEKTPGSFGTTSSSLIAAEKRKIKALPVEGVPPTPANVATGQYPYAMTLFLVYKRDRYQGPLKDFVEFVFSREGQKILTDNGHVTLPRDAGR